MPVPNARWVGPDPAIGHRLRPPGPEGIGPAGPARRAQLLIVGGGVAGLSAARRALVRGQDVHLLELDDTAGGHSRGHHLGGTPCPLGAHYLPVPQAPAHEVREWLFELGLLTMQAGREVPDERHLCHSPQERLFIDGAWHEGVLPPADPGSSTLAQYRTFSRRVAEIGGQAMPGAARRFALPAHRAPPSAEAAALDRLTFSAWLDAERLDAPKLRWVLDYACRDDYGAGLDTVSAWAGLHYFASRQGFRIPGDEGDDSDAAEAVFTWPQGNAWLVERLARPLGERLHGGRIVVSVDEGRHGVGVTAWNVARQQPERWWADRVVLAVPLFVARRLLRAPPPAMASALDASTAPRAPWLVANLHLRGPWVDRVGHPLAWDSVVYGARGLGYVHAQHQQLRQPGAASVVTAYLPLPAAARAALLDRDAVAWTREILDDLRPVHPDWPHRLVAADLARWGHAMAVPVPGTWRQAHDGALAALRRWRGRIRFAHADLAGYSVFEEAFTAGWEAVDG